MLQNPAQGTTEEATAFLNTLERVTVIRQEPTNTFGSKGGGTEPAPDAGSGEILRTTAQFLWVDGTRDAVPT